MKSGLDAKPLFLQVDMLKDSMQRPSCFHIKFLITIQALYYVTFQCGSKNIFRKIKKEKNCSQKVEKTSQKSCTLVAVGRVFFLCSPDCPEQPRTSFLFYRLFYPTISGRISVCTEDDDKNHTRILRPGGFKSTKSNCFDRI